MFRLEGTEKEKAILEKYLPNYRINLVDAERLEETERFSEDLQVILTMLKYRKDKDGLRNYVNENKQFFQKVDHETSQAMKAFLNMKHIQVKPRIRRRQSICVKQFRKCMTMA